MLFLRKSNSFLLRPYSGITQNPNWKLTGLFHGECITQMKESSSLDKLIETLGEIGANSIVLSSWFHAAIVQ